MDELAALPIDKTNRKVATTVAFAIILALSLSATVVAIWYLGFTKVLLDPKVWGVLIWDVASAWGIVSASRRKTRLLIDQDGVHLTEDGYTRHYRWEDIAAVRRVVVDARNGTTVAQITRKGQLMVDNKSDLIWGEFGISPEQLTSIVEAGKARWGGNVQAPGSPATSHP